MARERITYEIEGAGWPADPSLGLGPDECFRCTHLLGVINKPALVGWAGKVEGQAWEEALRASLPSFEPAAMVDPTLCGPEGWAEGFIAQVKASKGKQKAADKRKDEAADIGKRAHAWIEWSLKLEMGQDAGKEPACEGPVAGLRDAWLEWRKLRNFVPLATEKLCLSVEDRWAGTLDILGEVEGRATVIDIKSSNGIWPEQCMQVAAYCIGAASLAGRSEVLEGLILRLPKTEEGYAKLLEETGRPFEERYLDQAEVVEHYQAFLAAKELHNCMRRLDRQNKER